MQVQDVGAALAETRKSRRPPYFMTSDEPTTIQQYLPSSKKKARAKRK
jgi:hypothetical protein